MTLDKAVGRPDARAAHVQLRPTSELHGQSHDLSIVVFANPEGRTDVDPSVSIATTVVANADGTLAVERALDTTLDYLLGIRGDGVTATPEGWEEFGAFIERYPVSITKAFSGTAELTAAEAALTPSQ